MFYSQLWDIQNSLARHTVKVIVKSGICASKGEQWHGYNIWHFLKSPGLFLEQVKRKELRIVCSSVNQNGGEE